MSQKQEQSFYHLRNKFDTIVYRQRRDVTLFAFITHLRY